VQLLCLKRRDNSDLALEAVTFRPEVAVLRRQIDRVGAKNLIRFIDQGFFRIGCANNNVGNQEQ
jgi:hypothetical protein